MAKSKVIPISDENEQVVELLLGASGTHFFSGFFNISDADEYVTDLKGQKALETYNRMKRGDAQVKLALLALTHPIVDATWKIVPPGDPENGDNPTDQEIENTQIINNNWFNSCFEWEKSLRQILGFFDSGFSLFEKLYVYDGQYIQLKKLCPRLQSSIVEWDVKDENLQRVRQYITAGNTRRDVWIPADKLALFVFDQTGDDFRGNSVLRSAYKHWFYKDTFYRIQGMQIERWSLGIPKIEQTDQVVGNPNKTAAIEMAKNLRAHEEAYAYVPRGFKLELLDSGPGKMIDPQPAIQHHDAAILKAIMAQFLELGQTETGARSLGDTLMNMYMKGLTFSAKMVCEVLQNSIFRELTEWNFGDGVRPPKLTFSGLQPVDFELLSRSYSYLINSGAVQPDDKLEEYIRKQCGLPAKDDATVRQNNSASGSSGGGSKAIGDAKPDEIGDTALGLSHKRIKANIPQPFVPNGNEADTYIHFWRQLREAELSVSLREIVGKLDDSKEVIVRATREVRTSVINQLVKQVQAVVQKQDAAAINKIDYSNDLKTQLTDKIYPVLIDLVEYGRTQVDNELKKQKASLTAATPTRKPKDIYRLAMEYLQSKAEQFAEISLDKLVDEARIQAGNAIRTGTFSANAVALELSDFSDNVARRSAGYTVNEAFGFGRTQEAEDRKDEIAYAEYSAILDNGTCPPCEALDGQQFELDSPEYEQFTPPLSTCEGGSQCRCIWVYVSTLEQKAQA